MDDIRRFESLNDAITKLFDSAIESYNRVYGGDINDAFELKLKNGEHIFMKINSSVNADFFKAEAVGLAAISKTGAIRTPIVLGYGTDNGTQFLLLSYIESVGRNNDFWELFGVQLAAKHRADTNSHVLGGRFGFNSDNYIGKNNQINSPHGSWIGFYRECRLMPQFRTAEKYFDIAYIKSISRFLDRLDTLLIEPDRPSLLHGDLWSGNFITGSDGEAWLIDPAVYVGRREADIAMTELFGGFNNRFYSAYKEAAPFQYGYEDRRDIYNLYHLLNHLNLFGGSYLSSVKNIINRYI